VAPSSRTLVLGPAPEGVLAQLFTPSRRAAAKEYDVIIAFCRNRNELDRHAASCPARLTTAGGLWLCWLKRASGIPSDIGESDVQLTGLATGLVDVKIAAIDENWSGLRFVRRLADRPKRSSRAATVR
jgi:hypothetical protein